MFVYYKVRQILSQGEQKIVFNSVSKGHCEAFLPPCRQSSTSPSPSLSPYVFTRVLGGQNCCFFNVQSIDLCKQIYSKPVGLKFYGKSVTRKKYLKGSLKDDHEKKVEKTLAITCEKETCQTQFVQFVPHLTPKSPPYSSQVLVLVAMDNITVGDSAPCWESHLCLENSPPSLPTSASQPASLCSTGCPTVLPPSLSCLSPLIIPASWSRHLSLGPQQQPPKQFSSTPHSNLPFTVTGVF